jgi:hypothetical protein
MKSYIIASTKLDGLGVMSPEPVYSVTIKLRNGQMKDIYSGNVATATSIYANIANGRSKYPIEKVYLSENGKVIKESGIRIT